MKKMQKFFSCICIFTSVCFCGMDIVQAKGHENSGTNVADPVTHASDLIDVGKPEEALKVLEPLLSQNPTFEVSVVAAQTEAALNQPSKSLKYYQLALELAQNDATRRRIALFGIAKMQLWLQRKAEAYATYKTLLSTQLSPEDYALASAGLTSSNPQPKENKPVAPISSLPIHNSFSKAIFDTYVNKAQIAAAKNQPQLALGFFEQALQVANHDVTLTRIAKFGMAKMQLWLGNYVEAKATYESLLSEKLSQEDYPLATSGLAKSLQGISAQIAATKPAAETPPSVPGAPSQFDLYIKQAQKSAERNQPNEALLNYQSAFKIAANNAVQQRIAMFGMAKMQIWLEKYTDARDLYETLLKTPLSAEDKKIVMEGLKKIALAVAPAKKAIAAPPTEFDLVIKQARAYAAADMMNSTLYAYKKALFLAGDDPAKQRVALFGIGRTLLWEGSYVMAESVYVRLLNMPLDERDRQAALSGYAQSLVYQNKNIKAYQSIPPNNHFTDPAYLLAALQSSTWAGWTMKARNLLEQYNDYIDTIDPNSRTRNNLNNIRREILEQSADNSIAPRAYFLSDNEGFLIQRYGFKYSHRFINDSILGRDAVTSFIMDNLHYSQRDVGMISGLNFLLEEKFAQNDYLKYTVSAGGVSLGAWDLPLWRVFAKYTPNDYVSFYALNFNEVVESYLAVQNRIWDDLSSVGMAIQPFYRCAINGSLSHYIFSDSNNRNTFYATLDYSIFEFLGLNAEFRTRGFRSTLPFSPFYFDPISFTEEDGILQIKRRTRKNWYYYFQVGKGTQNINPGGVQPVNLIETGLEAPVTKHISISVMAGYSTAKFTNSAQGGAYSYKYGSAQINIF